MKASPWSGQPGRPVSSCGESLPLTLRVSSLGGPRWTVWLAVLIVTWLPHGGRADVRVDKLRSLQSAIRSTLEAEPVPSPASLQRLRGLVDEILARSEEEGVRRTLRHVKVELQPKGAPRATRAGLQRAIDSLETLIRIRVVAVGPPPRDAAKVLNEVLSRKEFQWNYNWQRILMDLSLRILYWIMEHLGLGRLSERAVWIVGWSLLILLSGLFLVLVFRVVQQYLRSRDIVPDTGMEDGGIERVGPESPGALVRRAQELMEAGDYRQALRLYYRAILGSLDRAGVVQYAPHRTGREYLRVISAAGDPIASPFARATHLFERHWYGGVPVTVEACGQLSDMLRQVQTAMKARPPVTES